MQMATGSDLIKSGMAIVGVAKFLRCGKTLVKNPSGAVGPYHTSDGDNVLDKFIIFCSKKYICLYAGLLNMTMIYKMEAAMGAEEEKKT